MKLKIYLNKLSVNIKDDFAKAKEYFARHNIPLEFEYFESNITGYKPKEYIYGKDKWYWITGHEDKLPLSKDFITVFCFNGAEFSNLPQSQTMPYYPSGGILISLMVYAQGDIKGQSYHDIIHELMHALNQSLYKFGIIQEDPMDKFQRNGKWLKYYKDNDPEALDGNFAEAWKRLAPHMHYFTKKGYTYFSEAEVEKWKLRPALFELLDKMRGECGFAFSITSGLRSKEQNDALSDSASDSAHLSGLAVDVACPDSLKRFKMVEVALSNGVKRIGIGKDFIHFDIDGPKPQVVMWTYYK